MTTPAQTPDIFDKLSQGVTGSNPSAQAAPTTAGDIFDQLASGTYKDPNAETPSLDEQRSQLAVQGFLGMGRNVDLSNPSTVPNARIRNLPRPDDLSKSPMQNFVDGAYHGALVDAPLDVLAAHGAIAEGFRALVPSLTKGVAGVGGWAAVHPIAAKIVWESLKAAITGTAVGAGAKMAGKVIRSSGE
jgi:hypothetical protein